MKNGFLKVAAASPDLRVADCKYNLKNMVSVAEKAGKLGVKLLVFPELSVTAYSCGDLFMNSALIDAAADALCEYLDLTKDIDMVSVLGVPLRNSGKLYNCAVVCHSGKILGIVAKDNLSAEESRTFCGAVASKNYFDPFGEPVLFDTKMQFTCLSVPRFTFEIRIGDGGISYISDANVIALPSASAEGVGKAEHRRTMLKAFSSSNAAGYVYANPGYGESTTDNVYSAHNIICENGNILAESLPFAIDSDSSVDDRLTVSEIDIKLLEKEKAALPNHSSDSISKAHFSFNKVSDTTLTRSYNALPFVPNDTEELKKRAETILKIQTSGLRRRMEAAYAKKCIIGISGGLDSTLALLVAARACDEAYRPRTDIIGITMPCFGTTNRTRGNAELLCEKLGIELRTVMIGDSVRSHFNDIGHDIELHDVVYENSQARERTQVLMDIANAENGIVVGTGDMSELALGWATYNGDHMSMYGVNASVSKTLVRAITGYCADMAEQDGNNGLAAVLRDIIDTPVSPELLPADGENIKQKTEDLVGPYEIHDFYLYYMLRFGFSPEKLYKIACHALGSVYSPEVLLKWLEVFIRRFFSQQYKRSCLPDGPSVGSVGLSPRGGLCMPSDASAALWRAEVERLKSK